MSDVQPTFEITASFADLIDEALSHEEERYHWSDSRPDLAAAMLAMPEMQAIKQALHDVVAMRSPGSLTTSDTVQSVMLRNMRWAGLPDSVQAWVLS